MCHPVDIQTFKSCTAKFGKSLKILEKLLLTPFIRSGRRTAAAARVPDPLRPLARRRQPPDRPLRRRLGRAQDERVQTGQNYFRVLRNY